MRIFQNFFSSNETSNEQKVTSNEKQASNFTSLIFTCLFLVTTFKKCVLKGLIKKRRHIERTFSLFLWGVSILQQDLQYLPQLEQSISYKSGFKWIVFESLFHTSHYVTQNFDGATTIRLNLLLFPLNYAFLHKFCKLVHLKDFDHISMILQRTQKRQNIVTTSNEWLYPPCKFAENESFADFRLIALLER